MESLSSKKFASPNEWLKCELLARQQKNPKFSARAFARQLKIGPGRMSEYLSGKRRVSKKIASKIADSVGFDFQETKKFVGLTEKVVSNNKEDYLTLDDEAISIVLHWYHYAILNLVNTTDCEYSYKFISKRLSIPYHLTKSAIERLIKCGLLENKNNALNRTTQSLTTSRDIPSGIIRQSHIDRLAIASERLESVDVSKRDYSSVVFNLDPDEIEPIKNAIEKFRRKIKVSAIKTEPKEVYSLSIQLFPLTQSLES